MTSDADCPFPGWLCKEERFIKVQPRGKAPVERWRKRANQYAWYDDELVAHRERDGNVSLVAGDGLLVIDIDEPPVPEWVDDLPDTFVVKTPGGGLHHYYRTEYGQTHRFPWGEIRSDGGAVACPGNEHPSGGEYYVLWDREIKGVPPSLMEKRIEEEKEKQQDDGEEERPDLDELDPVDETRDDPPEPDEVAERYDWMQRYPDEGDRSEFDFAVCCTMIRYGVPKHKVERWLESFPHSKVNERREGIDYGDTWNNARREVGADAGKWSLDHPNAPDP